MRPAFYHFFIMASTIAVDQSTKMWAQATLQSRPVERFFFDCFRLQYAENRGGFLSLGAGLPSEIRFALFIVLSAAGLLVLAWLGFRGRNEGGSALYGLTLVLAGGASNLYDRIVYDGVVIDFLNAGIGSLRTGVFNVADMAILGGTAWLLLAHMFTQRNQAPADLPDPGEKNEETRPG